MTINTDSAAYQIFRGIYKAGSQSEDGNCSVMDEAAKIAEDSENKTALTVTLEDFTERLSSLHGESYSNLTSDDTKKGIFSSLTSFFGIGETNVFVTEAGQEAVEENGNYTQNDIYTEANNQSDGIKYSESDEDFAQSALNFAKADIKAIEKAYSIANSDIDPDKKLENGEINSYSNTGNMTFYYVDQVDLDNKNGISAKEYASYMMLADGLVVGDKGISFDEDSMDGIITEDEAQAVADAKNDELQALALEIYEEYYK